MLKRRPSSKQNFSRPLPAAAARFPQRNFPLNGLFNSVADSDGRIGANVP